MTEKRTQLSYLDLALFYQAAKNTRDWAQIQLSIDNPTRSAVNNVCDKLTCVIDALRNDGLDPRWNPERDALLRAWTRGDVNGSIYQLQIDEPGADRIIEHLHSRGYKIVKDES